MTDPGTDGNERTDTESDVDTDGDADTESGRDRRSPAAEVTIDAPDVETAERLAAWWVVLADEQRVHDSHLLGDPNRRLIEEAMARHIVTDGLLVARVDSPRVPSTPGDRTTGANEERTTGADRGDRTDGRDGTGEKGRTDERGPTDGIVGFVMFGPETGSYEQSVDRGIIENVFVRADYRNRGIGGALLGAAEDALAESGVDTIALEVMTDNEAARRLYRRHGYRSHRIELEAPVERLGTGAEPDTEAEDGSEPERDSEPGSDRHTNERE